MPLFYRPDDGAAADVIPFYWDGAYHLFFLKDYRDPEGRGEGCPWWHLVTRDFVTIEDRGEALPRGAVDAQDPWVFTGSVIERDGQFHIFYTGHNSHFPAQGKPQEAIMHAVSPDLETWTKDPDCRLFAPEGYEPHDWRDPFVFRNDAVGEYWMLLAARRPEGPSRHRGCTALASSADLQTWEVRQPFWAPDRYYTHECPDLFRIGDWWYLVYSTFSDRFATHYRMARGLAGPWLAPPNDTFDGRAYYAAKTAGDGTRRYLFGWLASRDGESDDGDWQWGGELVVHEIVQQEDGTLTVRPPAAVLAPFTRPVLTQRTPVLGAWKGVGNIYTAPAVGRHAVLVLDTMPQECLVELTVRYQPGTQACGVLVRASDDLEQYYQLRLEPSRQRLVFDRWPRPGDQAFMIERPLPLCAGQPITLRILVDGTNVVAYANDRLALSCRMYQHREGKLGLFATEGEATFMSVTMKTR